MKTFESFQEGINYYIDLHHINKPEENLRYFVCCKCIRFLQKVKWSGIIPKEEEDILKLHIFLTETANVWGGYQGYGWNGHGGIESIWKLEKSQLTNTDYAEIEKEIEICKKYNFTNIIQIRK